jgi:hypothetical protein
VAAAVAATAASNRIRQDSHPGRMKPNLTEPHIAITPS